MTIEELARAVYNAFLALPQEEQTKMRREQTINFAYGNVHMHNPAVTRERIEQEYERLSNANANT